MDSNDYISRLTTDPIPKELAFTEAEYRARVARVRELMGEAGLDALLVHNLPNLCYLTGYQTFASGYYACLLLPLEGDPVMQVAEMELPGVFLTGWVRDVLTFKHFQSGQAIEQMVEALGDRALDEKNIGIEMSIPGSSHHLYRSFEELLPGARLIDASRLVFQTRLIKSPAEQSYLRQAGRINAAGLAAALEAIRPGVTDNDIARAAYAAMIGAGSEFMSHDPIVTTGRRSGWPHTNHKRVQVNEGDAVYIEVGGCYQRYTSPNMRTAFVGQPPELVRRLADASVNTVGLILENARPGRTANDVAQAARKGLEPVESEAFFHGSFGYSVGVGFPPGWNEGLMTMAEGVDTPLEAGMVFHLPIALRDPARFTTGFSETIAITESGCEVLTCHQPRELAVIGP